MQRPASPFVISNAVRQVAEHWYPSSGWARSPNTRWPADDEFAAVGDAEPPLGADLVLISITMLAIHIWALCGAGDQQTARLRQEEPPRNRLESRLTPR
jgi:hypothetical protein